MVDKSLFALKATEAVPHRTRNGVTNSYYVFTVKNFSLNIDEKIILDYSVKTVDENGVLISTVGYENAVIDNVEDDAILSNTVKSALKEIISYNFTEYATTNQIYGFDDFIEFVEPTEDLEEVI